MSNEKKLYSVKEVSDLSLIGFKERKIREFLKSGELKGTEILGGRKMIKISQEAINDFMDKNSKDLE